MKTLFFAVIASIICFGIISKVMAQTSAVKVIKKLPVIDKEKSYPEKNFKPETDVKYIPLETRKDILLDQGAHIYYVSDKRILITNWLRGDVFIFDMNGKSVSHFNQKGGLGYVRIDYAVYDEKSQEVFILDEISRKIVVFTEKGSFKRTLHLPSNMYSGEIYSFDDSTLLVYNEYLYGEFTQKRPYFFISKVDGKILSGLNIVFERVNSRILVADHEGGKMAYEISVDFEGNCKYGDEYILSNMSSDTVYILKKDKSLTPYFVQYPTVFLDPPIITGVVMKTKDYIVFSIYPYDLKESKRMKELGIRPRRTVKFLMYEFKSGQFFTCSKWNYVVNKVDLPINTSVELIQPYVLKEWLKRDDLTGELKKIASEIEVDANPIIKLIRFK
jgi:hypothetical protein